MTDQVITTESTTREGVDNNDRVAHSVDDVAAMFLDRWKDAEKPSNPVKETKPKDKEETPVPEVDDEDTADEEESTEDREELEDTDESEDTEDAEETEVEPVATKKVVGDDAVYKLTVDGEERTVAVKDLARLYGQEASLTRKSQELAAKRKEVEDTGAKHVMGLNTLIEKAQADFKPYAEIDFWVASKELSSEDFTALRQNAIAAKEKLDFLTNELDSTLGAHQERTKKARAEAATEALKVLSTKDWWSQETYAEIRTYGVKEGLPAEQVNNYTDPVVLEMMYKAMMHDKTKKVAATKKVANSPKKVLKPSAKSIDAVPTSKPQLNKTKLRSSDPSDITDAILGRWAK